MNPSHLDRAVYIHCCKDRTLTYRTADEPVFNGVALPVFSVDTKEEADMLLTLVCSRQYSEHPKLPGQTWWKINIGYGKDVLEYEDLEVVTSKLDDAYAVIKQAKKDAQC